MNLIDPLTHTVLRPVPGVSRSSAIAARLRDAIVLGVFPEGRQIPSEHSLTRLFDVAPMTIREALTSLRDDGLIVTKRGRSGGSFVSATAATALSEVAADATISDASETTHHVSAIVGKAAVLAAERASVMEIHALDSAVDRYRRVSTDNPAPLATAQAASQVAIQLARSSQSPRLTREVIAAQIEWIPWAVRAASRHLANADFPAEGQMMMVGLTDAVHQHDGARARQHVEDYVALQFRELAPALRDLVSPEGAALQAASRLGELLTETRQAVATVAERVSDQGTDKILAEACTRQLEQCHALSGIGFAADPESGRETVDWFVRESPRSGKQDERIRRRGLDISASAPGDEGYRGFDWYTLPRSLGQSTVVGPYVDYLCGDEYTLTVSVPSLPSFHAHPFTGVFVGDITVGMIERELFPSLSSTSTPLAVTHTNGRVLASTDAATPVGALVSAERCSVFATAEPYPYQVVSRSHQLEGEHVD